MSRISYRRAALWSVVLLIGVPVALQPLRPWILAHWPLPEPTVWQAVMGLVGQFIIIGLAVKAWNQRQRLREREREAERWKYRAEQAGWDEPLATDGGRAVEEIDASAHERVVEVCE